MYVVNTYLDLTVGAASVVEWHIFIYISGQKIYKSIHRQVVSGIICVIQLVTAQFDFSVYCCHLLIDCYIVASVGTRLLQSGGNRVMLVRLPLAHNRIQKLYTKFVRYLFIELQTAI